MDERKYKIVIDSLGAAGAGLMRSLASALNWPANRVARLMYLSPQVLDAGLEREKAQKLLDMLGETGLQASMLPQHEPFTEGEPDFDIALSVRNFAHIGGILELIVHVLGVGPEKAREIVCASPALLMGGVSRATVDALRPRFAALQCDLDVAHRHTSLYDLLLAPCPEILRHRVLEIVAGHVNEPDAPANPRDGDRPNGMIAAGLSHAQATRLWDELRGCGATVQLVNRAFERFDVLMQQAQDGPELRSYLSEQARIPAKVIEKLLDRLPIVILRQLNAAQVERALTDLSALGVETEAQLTTFQAFDLSIDTVSERKDRAVRVLSSLTDRSQAAAASTLHELPARFQGPFSSVHARWLQAELKAAGADSRLLLRK